MLQPTPCNIGIPEEVKYFATEDQSLCLEYLLWFKTAEGNNRSISATISNCGLRTPDAMRDEVLRYQKSFVRKNWFLIEVVTPSRQEYKRIEGGYRRLQTMRTLSVLN